MNLLVTGGAGYIGSVTADRLIQHGHTVTVFDNLVRGHTQAVPKAATFIEGDLTDRDVLTRLFREHTFDAVLHFAAFIEAGESMKLPARYFRNNSFLTLNLLEAMVAADVRKFVFSSTAALYGNPEEVPIQETAMLKPTNAYGESKLLVEQMLMWFHDIHGLRYASLRYFNAAGATADRGEAHNPETHLIPRILRVPLAQADHVYIFGTDYPTPDGTCIRDYIHLHDLGIAHLLAVEALEQHTRLIYNLGNGKGFSIREVIDVARKVTGHAIPSIEAERRPGDPAILVASSERIQRELGWKPKYGSLEDIIGSAWEWHRLHPNGYAGI